MKTLKKRVALAMAGVLLMGLGAGCQHTYEAVKRDGSKEYIKGYYIIPTDGDFVAVRGTWKTVHILKVESIKQVD